MASLGAVIYAARLGDGTIKVGWTEHFHKRLVYLSNYTKQDIELLAFQSGTIAEEQAIHAALAEHRHHGREYYRPVPEVLAVVNDMRSALNLPHVAA